MTATTSTRPTPTPPAAEAKGRPQPRRSDVRRTMLALAASALGTFPLCEVFTDTGWLIDVWLTMAVVIGPAALMRRTRPASAGQIWVGVLLMVPWLTVTFVREHAVLGFLPLRGAWHDIGADLTALHHTTSVGVAPIHTTVPVRLALCALLGLVAALVDLLAVVGRHGALAGVPLLIVFTVSGAVPRHPVSWIWFVLCAFGFLILLALDSSDDVQRWGYFVPRTQRVSRRAGRMVSGQRIAVIAIVLALAVPIFIPSDSKNLLSRLFHNGGDGASGFGAVSNGIGPGGIDPFAALRGELIREHPVPLFDVKVSSPDNSVGQRDGVQPFYLRMNTLSLFQGTGWVPGNNGPTEPLTNTQFESQPGVEFAPNTVQYNAQITISGLRSNPPVFGSPRALYGVSSDTVWNPQQMLVEHSVTAGGQVITEQVSQPEPSVEQLNAAPNGNDPELAPWLKLPAIRPYVQTLTHSIIANAATPYQRALAISKFFSDPKNNFAYSLQSATGDSGDELTDFLRPTGRVGYCQQYAAAMAVMLRLANVPSRVVLGYAHAVPNATGQFQVTTFDAHAWVEAYFGGIGWVPFDPTPLAGISGGAANDLPWAKHPKNTGNITGIVPHDTRSAKASASSAAPTRHARVRVVATGTSFVVPLITLGAVAVLVLIALLPAFVRWRRRRRRLHRVREGDTDALWAELADTTVDLGYVWSTARTPRQVAKWLGSSDDAASGAVQVLAAAVERARYSRDADGAGTDLAREFTAVRAGLGQRRSPGERMRARFWPASLNWSRARGIGRWLPGTQTARRH